MLKQLVRTCEFQQFAMNLPGDTCDLLVEKLRRQKNPRGFQLNLPNCGSDARNDCGARTGVTGQAMPDGYAEPIFNSDAKRWQVHLNPANHPLVAHAIETLHRDALPPNQRITDGVLLVSLPGCKRQRRHCDYLPTTFKRDDKRFPCGAVFASESRTRLRVWPGTHDHIRHSLPPPSLRFSSFDLLLEKGDVLLFRGDLVHAGSAYPAKQFAHGHARVHLYVDVVGGERERNTTFFPDDENLRTPTQVARWKEALQSGCRRSSRRV